MTTGTNTPLTLSASLAMGALVAPASCTRAMIWARVVSPPTFSARKVKLPERLMEAAMTRAPGAFSAGMLSPVTADSSTLDRPVSTVPSTGMRMPGLMTTVSPTATSSAGISVSTPSRSTSAVSGARSISARMAAPVRPLARASRNLPRVMRVRIVPADSK